MMAEQIREKILSYLVKGEVEEALTSLLSILGNSNHRRLHENVLILKVRWEGIKQEQLKGLLSRQEHELSVNKIIAGIQTIINDIDDNNDSVPTANIRSRSKFRRLYPVIGIFTLALLGIGYYLYRPVPSNLNTSILENTTLPKKDSLAEKTKGAKSIQTLPLEKKGKNKMTSANMKSLTNETEPAKPKVEEEPQVSSAIIETKMILDNADVEIKIDGQAPKYIGISTGIVRRIQLQEGLHKFEIIENHMICTVDLVVSKSTSMINPTRQ